MRRDDMIMERVFDVQRFIRASVQSTEVGIILCEQQVRLHNIDFRVNFKVVGRPDRWW